MVKGTPRVQSVDRALALLEIVAASDGDVAITTLAAKAGIHVSTAHRLLATLVARGYVTHDERTRRYRAGDALTNLAPRRPR